jgi:hypothetical protein
MLAFQFFMWGGYQPMYYIRTRNIFQHTWSETRFTEILNGNRDVSSIALSFIHSACVSKPQWFHSSKKQLLF